MKNIKSLAYALFVGLAMTACSPDEYEGASGQLPEAATYADKFSVTVDQNTNTAYFTFVETEGVTPVWNVDGEDYSSSVNYSKYWRKKGDHYVDCYVKTKNGMSKDAVRYNFEIENTQLSGFGGFDKESEHNLFNNASFDNLSFWFADENWSQIDNPELIKGADGKSFTLKIATCGSQRWQGQFAINETGIRIEAGKTYDFSAIVTSTNPITTNGVKIKLCQTDNDDNTLMDMDFKLNEANEPKALWTTELDGKDISNLKVVMDFGGTPENTEVMIEDFVLIEHQYNDVEIPEELATPFDYNDPGNVWKQFDAEGAYWEASWFGDAGWGDMGIYDWKCTLEGSHHKLVVPATTVDEQWHAQYSIHVDLPISAEDTYDLSLCVTSSKDLPGMTVKLTEEDDDGNYFMEERSRVKGEYVWRYENVKLTKDAPQMKFVFDFAGAEEGTEIDIYDITLIKK